ncbi:MAG: HTTM domain-containing protein [Planctomycetaceae bacterium]
MKSESAAFSARIRQFFFAEEIPYGAALARIFLPAAALTPMLQRFPRVRELYSTEGTSVQLSESFGVGQWMPLAPPAIAVALFAVMVACLVCGIVGWRTRISLAIGTVLYAYFNFLDTIGTFTKYSVLSTHLLLMLTLSNAGAIWSIDAFLKRRRQGAMADIVPPRFPVWPARMMQIVFAFMYFGAGITKIQTDAFFSGEQMRYWMLSNLNYDNPIGEVMAMWTPLLLVSAYITVVWEIVFVFLVWRGRSRFFVLGIGATFHFFTFLLLGLRIFPAICISGYLSFINERDVIWLRAQARRLSFLKPVRNGFQLRLNQLFDRLPAPLPAAATWILLVCATAVTATEVEYRADLYGQRRPEGLMPLEKMSTSEALAKTTNELPLREKDKFFSFELGSFTIGGQLANRRHEFEYGEQVFAQCTLNPPHEDMWVECILQDTEKRTIEQLGQFATRDMYRVNFPYLLGSRLVPGEYEFVLRSSGQEIYRRRFHLKGNGEQPADALSGYLTN